MPPTTPPAIAPECLHDEWRDAAFNVGATLPGGSVTVKTLLTPLVSEFDELYWASLLKRY